MRIIQMTIDPELVIEEFERVRNRLIPYIDDVSVILFNGIQNKKTKL